MSESKPVEGAVVPVEQRDLQLMLESGYLYLELQKPSDSKRSSPVLKLCYLK